MLKISSRQEIIKIANFLQSENTKIFIDKFKEIEQSAVKSLADRAYAIFGTWKEYDAYRSLLGSISSWNEMESFIQKCEEKLERLKIIISSVGFPVNVAEDISRQYLHKNLKDLDSDEFLGRVSSAKNKADVTSLLRVEKKKEEIIPELKGKDLSGLGKEHITWITKIILDSKSGGEAHSPDDIISLARSFRKIEDTANKKISEFSSYSELSNFIDDQSFDNKSAYIRSIESAANSNDMSREVYDDNRWKVVLIGSTVGGQWWGRDTSFCISGLENNLYSGYALSKNIDPYFIIDKSAKSADNMRKFTIAIEYSSGAPKISTDGSTMTDANNVGISLDNIKEYLGSDFNKILEKIMNDASTRSDSIGRSNHQKINQFIREEDDQNIIKYEKEIVADKNLSKEFFGKINNQDDAAKFKRTLYGMAKESPSLFLSNNISKSFLIQYFDIAAKKLAEIDQDTFLSEYSSYDWAKPHIYVAAKKLSEVQPSIFLEKYSYYDWAKPYLDAAAKKLAEIDPYIFLTNYLSSEEPWAKPYLALAAKNLSESNPEPLLSLFKNKDFAKPYLDAAAKKLAEIDPYRFLDNYSSSEEPWAKTYFALAAKKLSESNPESLLSVFKDKDFAKPYLDAAAKKMAEEDPYRFLRNYSSSEEPLAKTYFALAAKNLYKENPEYLLYQFKDKDFIKPYKASIIENLINKKSPNIFYMFKDEKWARPHLYRSIISAAEKDPINFFMTCEQDIEYLDLAKELLNDIIERDPKGFLLNKIKVFNFSSDYLSLVFENLIKRYPEDFIAHFGDKIGDNYEEDYYLRHCLDIANKALSDNSWEEDISEEPSFQKIKKKKHFIEAGLNNLSKALFKIGLNKEAEYISRLL